MRICRNMLPFTVPAFPGSQRRCGRLRCREVECSLGAVLDLSAGGMRVRSREAKRFPKGATVELTVWSDAVRFQVSVKVAWMRRTRWRAGELGLMFLGITPGCEAALATLARAVTSQDRIHILDHRHAA
jgi:c-di-GMP-binding flagellar brake protein YcgR